MEKAKTRSIIIGTVITSLIIFASLFLTRYLFSNLFSTRPLNVFLFFSIASIIIFPSPLDLLFVDLLRQDVPDIFFVTLLGIFIGQNINYFLGKYFAHIIEPFVKKKTKDWIHDKLYGYEGYAIFFVNLSPLPYTLMNFVSGITRYNYVKWFLITFSGLLLKFTLIGLTLRLFF